MTLAMVMAFSVSFSLAADETGGHFYAVDQNKVIYNDGDTLEIPAGYAAFVYFDNTYKEYEGKKVHSFKGYNQEALAEAGIILADEDYKTVGFKAFDLDEGTRGLRIDTAYTNATPGTELELPYWLIEDKEDLEWWPPLKLQILKIRITEAPTEPQPDVTLAETLMTVKKSTKTVKAAKLKKSAQTVQPLKVSIDATDIYPCEADVTYARTGGSSKLSVNKKTGKVTVKKGTKKGNYTAKIKITADSRYSRVFKDKTKTVSVKIVVK